MTISSETRTAGPFSGNGVTVAFPFSFKVFADADLLVVQTDDDGVETTKTLTTHYTVSRNADQDVSPGGTVTMLVAPPTDYLLTLTSNVGNLQSVQITNQGGFYPNVINSALDRLTILVQQLLNKINRSIKIPLSDGTAITTELPTAALRANKVMCFDADGNVDLSTSDIDDIEGGAIDAAASAAAAAASAAAALTSEGNADTSEANALTYSNNASASATAAQTAAASTMWQDVVFLTFASSPYTITLSDSGKLFAVDCSGGAVTVNLPGISTLNLTLPWAIGIKKTDTSANAVTVARNGTDTIDGGTSKSIATADSGAVFIPDTDTAPDEWTTAEFGASAGNLTIDRFSGTGAQTAFTLSVDPGTENNTWVYISGVYQQKNTYSMSGTTLTFSAAPASGTNNIEVAIGTTLSIGTPSDGTVSAAKLASTAITGQTSATIATGDSILFSDLDDSSNLKKGTVSDLLALATPSGLVLLQTQNASASASIAFNSTYLTSTYKKYIIEMIDVVAATDNVSLGMVVSEDNGSTYKTTNEYNWTGFDGISSSSTPVSTVSASGANVIVSPVSNIGNAAGRSLSGSVTVFNPLGTAAHKLFLIDTVCEDNAGATGHRRGGAAYKGTVNAINNIKLALSSGNITSGTFKLYGVL